MPRSSRAVWGACVVGLVWLTATAAIAQPFELTVKKDRLFGASEGTLVFTVRGVDYRTTDVEDARQWVYDDLKQIQILSPTRLVVETYGDQGWMRFGADRTFRFEVAGDPVSEELVTFLMDRVRHPLVVAVVPTLDSVPRVRVPVKLRQRIRGSDGTLELWDDHLAYRSDHDGHARVWRFADLHVVFQPDRHRLTVQAYEGGDDQTRAFEFDLKTPLPQGALEAIWEEMHGPSWPRIGLGSNREVDGSCSHSWVGVDIGHPRSRRAQWPVHDGRNGGSRLDGHEWRMAREHDVGLWRRDDARVPRGGCGRHRLARSGTRSRQERSGVWSYERETPLEILDRRCASGELTREVRADAARPWRPLVWCFHSRPTVLVRRKVPVATWHEDGLVRIYQPDRSQPRSLWCPRPRQATLRIVSSRRRHRLHGLLPPGVARDAG